MRPESVFKGCRVHDDGPLEMKLDPTVPSFLAGEYYRDADRRRRRAGWHRYKENGSLPAPANVDPQKVLAIVMGLATIVVILCLVIPT